ncbi:MAG TPA: enoyl-CoA hydratase-related protein [Caulobacteraceae bacterium]|nr:enoyl-CoA hydratase-related protein [Caulobacteraceae bacterium]
MADAVLIDMAEGAAWITLNRPESRNALSADIVNGLYDRLAEANAAEGVRAIVLTGAPPAFCAGADLKNPPGSGSGSAKRSLVDVLTAMMESPKPVIGAINGAAFAGGLGLVAACDIVIAAREAPFSFSEVRIGVIPAVISVVCVRKLGAANMMKLFLTGERFDGARAAELGLAHRAVPAENLREAVREEIEMIRLGAPGAVAEAKNLVRRVAEISIEQGFAETGPWSARLFRSPEAAEGMAAFREKRKPSWVAK